MSPLPVQLRLWVGRIFSFMIEKYEPAPHSLESFVHGDPCLRFLQIHLACQHSATRPIGTNGRRSLPPPSPVSVGCVTLLMKVMLTCLLCPLMRQPPTLQSGIRAMRLVHSCERKLSSLGPAGQVSTSCPPVHVEYSTLTLPRRCLLSIGFVLPRRPTNGLPTWREVAWTDIPVNCWRLLRYFSLSQGLRPPPPRACARPSGRGW